MTTFRNAVTMKTVKKIIVTEVSVSSSTNGELCLVQNYSKLWKCESQDI
jgi:hypothetical protein